MSLLFDKSVYVNVRSGGVVEVIQPITRNGVSAASSSTVIVTGGTGQITRVISLTIGSTTSTATYAAFIASLGQGLVTYNVAANTVASAYYNDFGGLMDTTALGENLRLDIGAGSGVYFSLKYIQFIP